MNSNVIITQCTTMSSLLLILLATLRAVTGNSNSKHTGDQITVKSSSKHKPCVDLLITVFQSNVYIQIAVRITYNCLSIPHAISVPKLLEKLLIIRLSEARVETILHSNTPMQRTATFLLSLKLVIMPL